MEKKRFIQEFKTFISRGNVVDMAVGVIIGSAFTKIVNSLVNDVVMPMLGVVTGGINFADLKYVITPATEEVAEVAIKYGQFIQNIIDFLLIAVVVFAMVKMINKMRDAAKKKEEEKPAEPVAPPPTPEDILLLREIRDSLKK
ncbi:MAG: large-conductance mechanosensitive channel protein MscL [Oscillospiraceae bacterium]|nr:large-conductance mechanosensitive channel protein MscL [Oscillospiraceae bacterium]MBQ6850897.1 large-conductance mechanosensitive channel protein MscL [Oscillospiraceae bacterium]